MRAKLLAAGLLLAAAACASPPPPAAPDFTKDDVVRGFERVAFGREFADADSPILVRFERPIRILVVREPGDLRAVRAVERVVAEIGGYYRGPVFAEIEHRAVNEVGGADATAYEMIVLALSSPNYERFHEKATRNWIRRQSAHIAEHFYFSRCGGSFNHADGSLRRAVVFLDIDDWGGRLDGCVVEEMVQALGLPDDDDALVWSIFNDSNGREWPGAFDNLLVSILYSAPMRAGMSRADAMALVPQIVDELWPLHLAAGRDE
jgi:hypothetical protein